MQRKRKKKQHILTYWHDLLFEFSSICDNNQQYNLWQSSGTNTKTPYIGKAKCKAQNFKHSSKHAMGDHTNSISNLCKKIQNICLGSQFYLEIQVTNLLV